VKLLIEKEERNSAKDRILDAGFEDVIVFSDFSYDDAIIGVSTDGQAIYAYDLMVEWLIENEGMTEEEAMEWIDFNTIRSLPYAGENAPIIMYYV